MARHWLTMEDEDMTRMRLWAYALKPREHWSKPDEVIYLRYRPSRRNAEAVEECFRLLNAGVEGSIGGRAVVSKSELAWAPGRDKLERGVRTFEDEIVDLADEPFLATLNYRYRLPLAPEWIPWLREYLTSLGRIVPLECHNCQYGLLDCGEEAFEHAVKKGLKGKQLIIEQGADYASQSI